MGLLPTKHTQLTKYQVKYWPSLVRGDNIAWVKLHFHFHKWTRSRLQVQNSWFLKKIPFNERANYKQRQALKFEVFLGSRKPQSK